ncbi:MAG: acyl carrier protein [Candidatus Dormibacteraceae bacterium]
MTEILDRTEPRERIRDFIATELLFGDRAALPADGASLLQEGVIDSTDVLELICFVEREFGVTVDDRDVIPQNFDSVEGMVGYLARTE